MGIESPPGKSTTSRDSYAPQLLRPIPRKQNRRTIGLTGALPFHGEDIWNAYELTWLDYAGKPEVGVAELRFPSDSPNIIESKSMKLYLNSLSMTVYSNAEKVGATIAADLAAAAGSEVAVRLNSVAAESSRGEPPGDCIDDLRVTCESGGVNPTLLSCRGDEEASETLHSNLFRSLCPVTGQPDLGSILISYRGKAIDRAALLRYFVSYRNHGDFHESCVERIFVDIKSRCAPDALTVYARYNRRGGIDINPFRSDFESTAANIRLPRQ